MCTQMAKIYFLVPSFPTISIITVKLYVKKVLGIFFLCLLTFFYQKQHFLSTKNTMGVGQKKMNDFISAKYQYL